MCGSTAELLKAERQRPRTQHGNVGLESDQEPLINRVALEKGVMQSL